MATDTGRCFLFFPMFASCSGSTLCCQQVTLARNPPPPSLVTESRRCGGASDDARGAGIDFEDAVLRTSAWEEVDFRESLLTRLDFDEDFLVVVSPMLSVLEELFLTFLSPFSFAFTCLGTEERRYEVGLYYIVL